MRLPVIGKREWKIGVGAMKVGTKRVAKSEAIIDSGSSFVAIP